MRRCKRQNITKTVAAEFEARPYSYWTTCSFPLILRRQCGGDEVEVEVELLEETDEHIQLGVTVSGTDLFSRFISSYVSRGVSVVVEKPRSE